MARNRIIKKEAYCDNKLIELEIPQRFMFIGMTNFADDEGIHLNNPKVLKAEIFPADDIKVSYIEKTLLKMVDLGLIQFNEGRTLYRIINWKLHQKINRPYPSKYDFVEENSDDSMSIHKPFNDDSLPNKKNKNKNKKKNNNKENKQKLCFFEFWDIYPRKIGKMVAKRHFNSKLKDHSVEEIIEGTKKWCDYWKNIDIEKIFIPHPTTFLSQERFMDLPDEIESVVEYRLDSTGNFYLGWCKKCNKSNFYRKEELSWDSKCCKSKILPSRDINAIQDVNAEA